MNLSKKEVLAPLALAALILLGSGACTPKPELVSNRVVDTLGQPSAPLEAAKLTATLTVRRPASAQTSPTVIPDLPPQIKSDPPPKKPLPDIVPSVVQNILSSPALQRSRNRWPENTKASITYFGGPGYAGEVVSEGG